MELTNCEVVTNNIQNLPDTPAIGPDELKKTFDKTGDDLKKYINSTLIPEIKQGTEENNEEVEKKIIKTSKYNVKTIAEVAEDEDYTIPTTYKVNTSGLDVYFEGCLLEQNEHYIERGTGESSTIRFKFNVPKDSLLGFVIRK